MNIKNYKHRDWIVYFSGDKWSPLGFSSWISLYTQKPFSRALDYFVKQAVVVWDGESTTCYIRESERAAFGKKVVKLVLKDAKYVDLICNGFRSGTDQVLAWYASKKKLSYSDYLSYNSYFLEHYYKYHLQVKNVVDFLPKHLVKSYLPKLQFARVHAEPVFSREIAFMEKLAKQLSKTSGYQANNLLFSLTHELGTWWHSGKKLPSEKILQERRQGCAIFFGKGKIEGILSGKDLAQLSSVFASDQKSAKVITGQSAFKGKARGTVRIIFDPAQVKIFNKGDILVAPWTRPEYLPIMKKAAAFITDGGGILSHAAIVARELKKPCVIATKQATKWLKDGDEVEVDATKGTVRKIK